MEQQQRYKYFIYSLLLHLIIFFLIVASFDFTTKMPVLQNAAKNTEIINAMVMEVPPLSTQVVPQPKPSPPPRVLPVIKSRDVAVKKDTVVIPNQQQKKLQQELIAKALLADLKKHAEKQKKIKQKALESAFAQELKELRVKSLQQQMLREQRRIAGARAQQVQGEVNKYKALILQVISQHWVIPPAVDKKLSAELLIRLAPGGTVLDVQLMKSSGDAALDRSARAAVFKSSPLPVPPEAEAFDTFRQFVLKVKPQSILSSESWMD